MPALSIQPTYPIFTDIDGQPLEDGFVWIGTTNLDPQSNPISVYWDAALTLPAVQPIRTLAGYPSNSGSPARLYVSSDYSIRVMNKKGSTVYSAPAATERYSQAVVSGTNAQDVVYDPPFASSTQTNLEAKLSQIISAKDFGAVGNGTADDTLALQAFFDACQNGRGYIPPGVYKITSALNLYPQYSYNVEGAVYKNTSNAGTVIYNLGTGNAIRINNEPYTPPNFDSQIRLSNMTVSGNSGSQHGVFTSHAMIYLENVWINGHGGHGLYLERAYASSFKQVTCANNYKCGAFINTANNAVHFDHCVFNGNSRLDGWSGVQMGATPDPLSENFGVVFTSCDFTGNGQTAGVATAFGVAVQKTIAASFIGCYWEGNKSYNIYSDSSSKNLTVSGGYFQDSNNSITTVDGLIYENNFHLQVSTTTRVDIIGGMPTSRIPVRMFGNTYSGGAVPNPSGGVTENIQLWYSGPPTAGTWKRGDIVWNSGLQSGGNTHGWVCIAAGTPGTWLPLGQIPYVYGNQGDADATLTVFSSFTTNLWQSPLTANRTVTLSTTGAVNGAKFRISRTAGATGAFTLNVGVGPMKALAAGQWCDVEYTGSAWALTAFGSL